jgi:hypothetical protein
MPAKPETTFTQAVHKILGSLEHNGHRTYYEKMFNPYRSGTPDVWYSGYSADLWIEYKYIPVLPVRADIKLDLSERQKEWISLRRLEGRNVVVVCGSKCGAVIFVNGDWLNPISPAEFQQRAISRKELALWIFNQTMGEPSEPAKRTDNSGKSIRQD